MPAEPPLAVNSSARIRRQPLRSLMAVLCVMAAATASRADVYSFGIGRQLSHYQYSEAAPTIPEFWGASAALAYDVPNEVLSSTLEFDVPPPISYSLYQAVPTAHFFLSTFYTSEAEFLVDFPETTYTLTADRGAGLETGSVYLPADLFCEEIPYFTGDTYTRMQSIDPSADFVLTINGFTLPPGTTSGYTQIALVQEAVGGVFVLSLEPWETEFTIPAGTMLPDTNYSISITSLTLVEVQNAGFGGATGQAEYYNSTSSYFTTLSAPTPCCPGDFNNDQQVNGLDIQGFVDALLAGSTCE